MEQITLEQFKEGTEEFKISDEIIPVVDKIECARLIADEVCKPMDNGIVVCNEVVRDIYASLYGINLYTNIKIEILGYDTYDSCVVNGFIKELNDKCEDYHELIDIVKKVCSQREKENDLASQVAEYMINLRKSLDGTMGHVNDLLDRIDPNELNKAFGQSLDVIANKLPDLNNEKTVNSLLKVTQLLNKKKA